MVRYLKPYTPLRVPNYENYENERHTSIRVAVRILQRNGTPVIEFGEFSDLISYSDTLSVSSFGTFSLTMKASLANESLLKRLHPGLVMEFYAARNDDPLRELTEEERKKGLEPLTGAQNPPVFTAGNSGDCAICKDPNQPFPQDHQTHSILQFNEDFKPPETPPDYLERSPYLLMRGIITAYGRSSSLTGGGAETYLVVSGEGYGKIYRDAIVHYNMFGPNIWAKTFPHQFALARVDRGRFLYYGLLRHWVEEFWGEPTGWEARTRPPLLPPWMYARFSNGGQVWGLIQSMNVPEMVALFVDHTGAIVWTKQPWSGRDQALVDKYMQGWADPALITNWEDLVLFDLPSWKIAAWSDRLTEEQVLNFVTVQKTVYAGLGGTNMAELPSEAYNMGSIQQYGGPRIKRIEFPWGTRPDDASQEEQQEEQRSRLNLVADAIAEEFLRWVDRPVQRVAVQVRGEPFWRVHTRVQLKEDWHSPDAKFAEYYVAGRSHQIDFQRSGWVSNLDLIRDRRERYLGLGIKQDDVPWVAPDSVRIFDRSSNSFKTKTTETKK